MIIMFIVNFHGRGEYNLDQIVKSSEIFLDFCGMKVTFGLSNEVKCLSPAVYLHILLYSDMGICRSSSTEDEDGSDMDTIEFELKVKCSKNTSSSSDIPDPSEIYKNSKGSFLLPNLFLFCCFFLVLIRICLSIAYVTLVCFRA